MNFSEQGLDRCVIYLIVILCIDNERRIQTFRAHTDHQELVCFF